VSTTRGRAAQPPTIQVGLTTTVLAERFRTRSAPHLSPEQRAAWWRRTDYAWICSHASCKDRAGVNYQTPRGAHRGATTHAKEHPGATIKDLTQRH
jgi:hypothetical protein